MTSWCHNPGCIIARLSVPTFEGLNALYCLYTPRIGLCFGNPSDCTPRGSKICLRALSPQAFIGYSPIEEGGDNEITLHSTLSCDLSELLGATGVGGTGSSTKVRAFSRGGVSISCSDQVQEKWKLQTRTPGYLQSQYCHCGQYCRCGCFFQSLVRNVLVYLNS